jgi:DNA polymerase-3 subunit epsilon
MNPGFGIGSFIEEYTGITNEMLSEAPPCSKVMKEFESFAGTTPIVAHNSSFDKRFLESEWERIDIACKNEFACSMLTARRVYPTALNHRLETLVAYSGVAVTGTFHRALADADMTARLWLRMLDEVQALYDLDELPFSVVQSLSRVPKKSVPAFFSRLKRKSA